VKPLGSQLPLRRALQQVDDLLDVVVVSRDHQVDVRRQDRAGVDHVPALLDH
jgi:hypothetical protein